MGLGRVGYREPILDRDERESLSEKKFQLSYDQ